MNLNTWKQIRHQTATCFERSRDALFELVDALTSEPQARSLPELSLSPVFRRQWARCYEALEDGRINKHKWSQVWTAALLSEHCGPVWVSVDSTSIGRPEAETSPDRGIIYVPNMPHAKRPVSVGWHFSTVMLLPETREPLGSYSLSKRRGEPKEPRFEQRLAMKWSARPNRRRKSVVNLFDSFGCALIATHF